MEKNVVGGQKVLVRRLGIQRNVARERVKVKKALKTERVKRLIFFLPFFCSSWSKH